MTPAEMPTECEACREMKKDYPTGLGPMYGDPENNYGKFDIVLTAQAHHRALSEANARVGELEEGLRLIRQLNSWGNTTWPNVVERLLKSAKDGRGA